MAVPSPRHNLLDLLGDHESRGSERYSPGRAARNPLQLSNMYAPEKGWDLLRILHVVEAHDGGVLSLMRIYARGQAARGHDIDVLAPADRAVEGTTHHHWPVGRSRPAGFPAAISSLHRVVRDLHPDVVHLHSFFAGFLGRARRLPEVAGTPAVVYQPHSWAFDAVSRRSLRRAIVAWERAADRRTTLLVGNCAEEVAEGHHNGVRTPGMVLGLPVDTNHFSPGDQPEREGLRQRFGLREPHVAVCVGRLSRQKGQDRLVAAWERSPLPDTQLVLVGGGDDSTVESLRASAPGQWGHSIIPVGHQVDVRGWLRSADLMVLPSRYEGQSVAVAEALACGLPLVMCDVNGARAAVTDGPLAAGGAVVAQGDMSALLAAGAQRLADPGWLAAESKGARRRALRLFAADAVLDQLDLAYARALDRASGPRA